tara:strand:+ start:110 stop:556 length:447 start_codon:yes stop_codon:yes gene_type:complete
MKVEDISPDILIFMYFLLFFYSGLETFMDGNRLIQKTTRLQNKLATQNVLYEYSKQLIQITSLVMVISSSIIMYHSLRKYLKKEYKNETLPNLPVEQYIPYVYNFFTIFLIIVTLIYYSKKPIAFLTNLSLLAGLLIMRKYQTIVNLN